MSEYIDKISGYKYSRMVEMKKSTIEINEFFLSDEIETIQHAETFNQLIHTIDKCLVFLKTAKSPLKSIALIDSTDCYLQL